MTENTEALRLRMVEPPDMDEAARTLTRAGLLVPLTDWSAKEWRFDIHPRWLGILTALLVPVGIAGWASLPTSSVSTPAAVGAGVAAFVLGIALEVWIATHHPPVPETPAQVLSDVFGVDAALKDGARPFHREGFTRLTVRDGDGRAYGIAARAGGALRRPAAAGREALLRRRRTGRAERGVTLRRFRDAWHGAKGKGVPRC